MYLYYEKFTYKGSRMLITVGMMDSLELDVLSNYIIMKDNTIWDLDTDMVWDFYL